ncbi:MAG: hypothetical protein QF466_06980 [Desulfobacterales bacterium]|jgi:hypothetical protein|nr:hypothetical protein [Desulfobacter sp.]MDP6395176.1 hypothetical protein [Desulfobacterales bacterium]MDP6683229.1 hypothetical protein [Desulfobacterales bacterium]MDP6806350.1 hypothetical protein [Desulfobacterales bacterium]MDP7077188.1 hypothetical protein [Desulfobacterales bacterium]|tara:strand:+ start:439 stop:873 length:435 start_codon:yes stop_codon:yes gene_type:complete
MGLRKKKNFATKHGPRIKLDRAIENEIAKRIKEKELSCADAFEIAEKLRVSSGEVGISADLLGVKIIKCQLGLFGYKAGKKILKSQNNTTQDLTHAIENALVDGKLPCENAWSIASRLNVQRLTVSRAGEEMGLKIKSCQLGAF